MAKSAYKYIHEAWKKPSTMQEWQKRLIEWRKEGVIVRLEHPTRLDRAHALGYKTKNGYIIVRVRLKRGGRKRARVNKGRRSKRQTIRKTLMMNYKGVAEQRAERKYKNMIALNSYWVGQDGINYWFEVILVDPNRPEIKNNPKTRWICSSGKRAMRGLTSTARKSRGLG